jgi:cell pole-organizing protein PopZ
MAEERDGGDQSMEDILASIRRIISEDGTEAGSLDPLGKGDAPLADAKEPALPVAGIGSVAGVSEPQSGISGAEGRHGHDDLADIVEGGPDPLAAAGIVASEALGSTPERKADLPPIDAARAALERVAGAGTEESARLIRTPSLTERLSLRERMASLDFKSNRVGGQAQSEIEPVARRETSALEPQPSGEVSASAEVKAPEAGGSGSTGRSAPKESSTTSASEGVGERSGGDVTLGAVRKPLGAALEPVSGKQVGHGGPEAGLVKPDGEWASAAGAAQVVAVKDGEVIGIAPSDFKGAGSGHESAGGTPQSGARSEAKGPLAEKAGDKPLGARPTGALSVEPANRAGDAQIANKSAGEVKEERAGAAATVAAVASPPDEKKLAIPSSNAVGVAALNEAGRRREETREPPREVVEAARDALDGDSKDEGKTEEARPASGSRSLEEVVRDALQPVLKSWLDENLPKLIEKQLREEVGRALGKMKRNAGG